MLEVQIENILPVTEARDKLNQLIDSVESSDNMYVMTKNGKPVAILVGVHHLEKLTGDKHDELFGNNNKLKETEKPMDNPMDPTPAPSDDANAVAPAAGASQATPPADDATAPADGMPPVVSDSQSAMAGEVIPEETAETPAPVSPFAPAEPTIMTPAEPAATEVVPTAPATSSNSTIGQDEKPADADDQSATPTPPPAAPAV